MMAIHSVEGYEKRCDDARFKKLQGLWVYEPRNTNSLLLAFMQGRDTLVSLVGRHEFRAKWSMIDSNLVGWQYTGADAEQAEVEFVGLDPDVQKAVWAKYFGIEAQREAFLEAHRAAQGPTF